MYINNIKLSLENFLLSKDGSIEAVNKSFHDAFPNSCKNFLLRCLHACHMIITKLFWFRFCKYGQGFWWIDFKAHIVVTAIMDLFMWWTDTYKNLDVITFIAKKKNIQDGAILGKLNLQKIMVTQERYQNIYIIHSKNKVLKNTVTLMVQQYQSNNNQTISLWSIKFCIVFFIKSKIKSYTTILWQ